MRDVVNAIFYIAQSGCHRRMLPKELPPFTTVQYYFYRWRDNGRWCRINHALVMHARALEGRSRARLPALSTASR
jgi:transposase